MNTLKELIQKKRIDLDYAQRLIKSCKDFAKSGYSPAKRAILKAKCFELIIWDRYHENT